MRDDFPTTAVILAGGQGTRLRPLTDALPKPLLPIGGSALLEHIVFRLGTQGIRRAALATGYRAAQIEAYFGAKYFVSGACEVEMNYFAEEAPRGSGGALHYIRDSTPPLLDEPFIVTNADVLNDADLRAAWAFHKKRGALATLVCGRVENPHGFGICELVDEDEIGGRIARWLEKPHAHETTSRWANLGWWIFEPRLLDEIGEGFSRVEDDLFARMAARSDALFAFRHRGYWLDVGTPERLQQAKNDARENRFPLAPRTNEQV